MEQLSPVENQIRSPGGSQTGEKKSKRTALAQKGASVSELSTEPVVAFHVPAAGHATDVSNRKGLNALPGSAACGRARPAEITAMVDGMEVTRSG
jgi:hypothetical protein